MKASFKVDGLREIDNALAVLPKATSKVVVRRALAKELQPVADMANSLWPGSRDDAFGVSSKLKRGQRESDASATGVTMYVGSTPKAPQAHLLEWGTGPRFHKSGKYVGAVAPQPMLTPSWDARKGQILEGLAASLREEIKAALARRAKRGL